MLKLYQCTAFENTTIVMNNLNHLVKKHFLSKDLQNLRKQVHKIKPAFGFAGLRETETICQQFEDSCISVSSTEALTDKYNRLAALLDESCLIIQEEITKLKAYQN